MNAKTGKVIALAVKPDHYAAMQDAAEIEVAEDGIKGSAWATSVRRVTILFAEQWEDVQRELGADLSWHLRRANVLVSGLHPADLVKKRVNLGGVALKIHGETKPCVRMDEAHMGLQAALKPDLRGGVYGSVVQPGRIAVGDTVTVAE